MWVIATHYVHTFPCRDEEEGDLQGSRLSLYSLWNTDGEAVGNTKQVTEGSPGSSKMGQIVTQGHI